MKSGSGYTESARGFRLPGRLWLRSLAAVAMMLLLTQPIGAGATAAVPPSSGTAPHVYLLRGLLNIFSLGLDGIASQLEAQGIPTTIVNYLAWESLADEAAADFKSGRVKTIILVGHSSGATVLPDVVARLDQLGAPVKLAIGLDSIYRTSLSGRVGRYINFYIANGNGEPVAATKKLRGSLENVNVQDVPGIGHMTIDKNEVIQRKVISAIDAVAFASKPKDTSTKPRPEAAATAPN
jgi:hypothetical protein